MATLGEWLNVQRDGVPETLWRRIDAQVDKSAQRPVDALPGLRVVAEAQMAQMRTLSCAAREDALDLLTTDAMVTYLLELAASSNVQDLNQFAGDVLSMVVGQNASTSAHSRAQVSGDSTT